MFKIGGKYGDVHIDGMSVDIEKKGIQELKKYVEILELQKNKLTEQQNEYLSQIIEK